MPSTLAAIVPSSELFVAGAALIAATINAGAGGGSFITFPALLAVGVPPVSANATNNLGIWLGNITSVGGLRGDLDVPRPMLIKLLVTSVIGSLIGAYLLLRTKNETFVALLPFLLLGATVIYILGPRITRATHTLKFTKPASPQALIAQLIINIYGGFFGAAQGILLLALFSIMGLNDARKANALKNFVGMTVNGIACIPYVLAHLIDWPTGIAMSVGSLSGGLLGAHIVKRLPSSALRGVVIVVASSMTLYFFWKTDIVHSGFSHF
ncbi:MAG TPA: sulfite exporter TauE/SafE family protein [Candidatus Baltobacteraceae bacterium]|jgi:hypothetical protein|nr:sulfite exporter TauE/SafE family protein [Candidatus Baltobacteraceae bacterium]